MNEFFEPLRGTWIAHNREVAEDQRNYIRKFSDQIPTEIRDRLLAIVEYTDLSEQCCDQWNEPASKRRYNRLTKTCFWKNRSRVCSK